MSYFLFFWECQPWNMRRDNPELGKINTITNNNNNFLSSKFWLDPEENRERRLWVTWLRELTGCDCQSAHQNLLVIEALRSPPSVFAITVWHWIGAPLPPPVPQAKSIFASVQIFHNHRLQQKQQRHWNSLTQQKCINLPDKSAFWYWSVRFEKLKGSPIPSHAPEPSSTGERRRDVDGWMGKQKQEKVLR